MIPSTSAALRSEGHRSIVVIRNYRFDPITAVSCRAKDHPLGPPSNLFRPRRNPPLKARALVEAPGTAPGSERLIPMPIYRHSHPRERRFEYRGSEVRREGAAGTSVHSGEKADACSGTSPAVLAYPPPQHHSRSHRRSSAPRDRGFAGGGWLECNVFREPSTARNFTFGQRRRYPAAYRRTRSRRRNDVPPSA